MGNITWTHIQTITGGTWDYSLLQEPLSRCFVTIRDRLKSEQVEKSLTGIFCGYGRDTNAYKVYLPDTNTFITSGYVYFAKAEDYAGLLEDEEGAANESVDPASTPIGGAPAMAGVNKSGTILDYKLWLPCAVRLMENF